jgi:hypothetical protein
MVKWLIYWWCIMGPKESPHNIAGIMTITNDSVRCYVYPHQYTSFKIDYIKIGVDRDNYVNSIQLIGSRPYCKLILIGNSSVVNQTILINKGDFHYRNYMVMTRVNPNVKRKKK